jgi:hypothetical protein
VATPASGGVVDLLSDRTNAWLAQDVSAAGLAQVLRQAIETLEAETPSWDRQRSEKLPRNGAGNGTRNGAHHPAGIQVGMRALPGPDGPIAEHAPVAGMTDEPRAARYAEFSGEFEFERAFEAYEALIDTLCAGCHA